MIFKLIVNKDEAYNVYEPTNIFHVDAFLSLEDSRTIVALAKQYVKDNDVASLLYMDKELHLSVEKADNGFIITPTTKVKYSQSSLFDIIQEHTYIPSDDFMQLRGGRELTNIRSVAFSAMIFFGGESYSSLQRQFGFDHATIMHARKQTLPSLLYSKHPLITSLVEKIAFIYGSNNFMDFCREFDYRVMPKTISNDDPIVPYSKYCGVYKCPNKGKIRWRAKLYIRKQNVHVGIFDTPKQAAEARKQYCRDNNISLRNNRVSA